MPILHLQLLEGRSVEQKTALLEDLTTVVERHLGVDPDRIHVLITEISQGHWARAGVPLKASQSQ